MNLLKIGELLRYNDRYMSYLCYRRRVITSTPRDHQIFIYFWSWGYSYLVLKTSDFEINREFDENLETASV